MEIALSPYSIGVRMTGVCRSGYVLAISLILAIVSLGSFGALSNPIAPHPDDTDTTFRVDDSASGIALLVVMNILVNLFWICVLLFYVGKRFGADAMKMPATGMAFVLRVLLVAAVVTMVGAFVDYAFVMGLESDYSGVYKVIQFDPLNWLVAIGIIFLSILCAAYIFLSMPVRPLLILAGVIAVLNPAWWLLTGLFGNDIPIATIFISALILPIALKGLLNLHSTLASAQRIQRMAKAKDAPDPR